MIRLGYDPFFQLAAKAGKESVSSLGGTINILPHLSVAQLEGNVMRSTAIAVVMAFAMSGTAVYSQTRSPGSPAAKQDIGDPLIRKPTSQDRARGVTTGNSESKRLGGSREQIGGTPASQQSPGSNGGQ